MVRNSNTNTKYTLVDKDNNASSVGVMGWIQHDSAKKLFSQAGLDFDTLKQQAVNKGFKAVPLKLKANLTLNNKIELAQSHNVAALLPGSEHKMNTW